MKLLLVSDLDYAIETARLGLRIADWFDLVVIAGDHLDITRRGLEAQIVVISKYLTRPTVAVPR